MIAALLAETALVGVYLAWRLSRLTYCRRYGYPWRWAVIAEACWRVEHWPHAPGVFYAWRHAAERRGSPVLRSRS